MRSTSIKELQSSDTEKEITTMNETKQLEYGDRHGMRVVTIVLFIIGLTSWIILDEPLMFAAFMFFTSSAALYTLGDTHDNNM